MESRVIDEERFLLDRCIRHELESGNLMGGNTKVSQRRERRLRCIHGS